MNENLDKFVAMYITFPNKKCFRCDILVMYLCCLHFPRQTQTARSVCVTAALPGYLWQAVRSGLKDDQKNSNGHSDLLQLQVVSHPGPAQHTTHTVLGGHSDLAQTYGQVVKFGR